MDRKRRRHNADSGPPYVPPAVHVQYSNLAPESRKKLVEKLTEWAEWQTDKYPVGYRPPETLSGALSCKPELLRPSRGKLPAWEDRPAAPSKPPSAAPHFNISYEQIGDEVPAYDRNIETPLRYTPRGSRRKPHPHTLFTAPADGEEVGEEVGGRATVTAPAARANRCFNCGSYAHSVNDCFRAYNPQVVEQARRELADREGRSDYRSPAKRYFLVGAAVPGGGPGPGAKEDSGVATAEEMGDVQPGQLSQELLSMLGLGPLDPPPWLGRMQALGVPPGYLTREAAAPAPPPAGPEAAPPLPPSPPPPLPGETAPPEEDFIPCVPTPSRAQWGQQEGGREQRGGRYVCNVQFPGVNAPIPEGAAPGVWNMKPPGFAAAGVTAGSWQPSRSSGEGSNSSGKRRKFKVKFKAAVGSRQG